MNNMATILKNKRVSRNVDLVMVMVTVMMMIKANVYWTNPYALLWAKYCVNASHLIITFLKLWVYVLLSSYKWGSKA